ncbi:MAG TPA: A/G-specific adenine glycosylase [Opitutaceae bacterium]|nr:A/G-specific adenine glycosylase [Opitutaceae bacterium]
MPPVAGHLISDKIQFQRVLLDWYRIHARGLPWRAAPSLYKTVVSEFMLQQTQVKTVLPYFARWLAELPDFATLAAAPEARVLKLWEGLGYYARARNLHRLARAVAARPAPPRTAAEWLDLPGVGPYTAAAIASISFGEPAACVDGNVVRILARLTADGRKFRDSASAAKALAPLAAELIPVTSPGDHNQAMMELGATVCLRANPLCTVCPVMAFCAAGRRGDPEDFPRLALKKIERRTVVRVWCEHNGRLLLHRAAPGARRLAGLHELPTAEQAGLDAAAISRGQLLAKKNRGITCWQITESIYSWPEKIPARRADLVRVSLSELDAIALSGPHRRWVKEILAARKD